MNKLYFLILLITELSLSIFFFIESFKKFAYSYLGSFLLASISVILFYFFVETILICRELKGDYKNE